MTESKDMQLLSSLLGKAGWREADLGPSDSRRHLDCAFVSEYALLGVLFSSSTTELIGCWADSQAALMRMAPDDATEHLKDYYLVFFVNHIEDANREELRTVTDDAHECRKTCVETKGRPLGEVLAELPFVAGLAGESRPSSPEDEPNSELAAAGLTSKLLNDLGRRGASAILEQWLQGNYGTEKDTHASEEH